MGGREGVEGIKWPQGVVQISRERDDQRILGFGIFYSGWLDLGLFWVFKTI